MKTKNLIKGMVAVTFLLSFIGVNRLSPAITKAEAKEKTMKVKEIFTIGIDEPAGKQEEPYQFYLINSVCCDEAGNIYVLDEKAVRIKVFDKAGKFLREMLREGKGPNEIANVARAAVNPYSGTLFVLQEYGFTMKEFDLSGNFIKLHRLPEQFFNYFEFVDKDRFVFISVRRTTDENPDMTLKVVNLEKAKVEHSFAPGKTENALRVFQRLTLFENRLWTSPADKMELTAYYLDTDKNMYKQARQIPIPGKYKKNIVRSIKKGGLTGLQPIYFNLAHPVSISKRLFALLILQDYKLQDNDSEAFPESTQLSLYQVKGDTMKKIADLPDGSDMKMGTTWGSRLILYANEPYPRVKVFEIIENQ